MADMIKRSKEFTSFLRKIYLVALLITPIVLVILPATYFDYGQTKCLSVIFFHQECYGCGMTRAIQHLIHFDIERALQLNKIAFIVLAVLIYMWFSEIKRQYKFLNNSL
jgi:hypothetical protein